MKQASLWADTALPEFESLKGHKKTDVLIIGGGICGLLCAYFLKQAGVNYILAEGNRICGKITQNTTAKITFQHGLIYDRLIAAFGFERAKSYLSANQKALNEYTRLCRTIDCGFEEKNAYTYSVSDKRKIEKEVWAVNRLGFPAEFVEHPDIPLKTEGAIRFPKQAQFHPLKFAAGICTDLNIYENTFIRQINAHSAVTENGVITADKIIIATHFPFLNRHGSYFLKLYQHRSYVAAFEDVPLPDGMYVDESDTGLSFRTYDRYLLLGGAGHRTGKKGAAWNELLHIAKKYYPDAKPRYQWAAQDCMSLDGIPYIGQYAKATPNLYVASGFNKWGMTSSMTAAMLLRDMILNKTNEYAEVFSPQRSIWKPQLLINVAESAAGLLTPLPKRCPHLGCALKWNPSEKTWDCPCHGSRFAQDGKLLDNPATASLPSSKP